MTNMSETENEKENSSVKKKNKRNRALRKYVIIVTVIDLLLMTGCIVLMFENAAEKRRYEAEEAKREAEAIAAAKESETGEEELEVEEIEWETLSENDGDERVARVKTIAERGTTALEMLKVLFPQQMVVADEGAFHFFDINKNLKMNEYDMDSFALNDDGWMTYTVDGENTGYKGIDVSEHNGVIDWEQVAEDEVEFTYIRAGIRGYGSGKLVEDEQFQANMEGAANAGLNVGVYFFTQALTEEEAMEEADFVAELLKDKKVDIPVALDVEKVEDATVPVRTKDLSKEQYSKNVIAFCRRMKENGYDTIIYGNGKTFMILLDIAMLEDYDKWFADYIGKNDYLPYFPYNFRIWQYDSTAQVKGVKGDCDVDLALY